jgi:hypothetical protein
MGYTPGPPTDRELGIVPETAVCWCGHDLPTHDVTPDGYCAACTCTAYYEEEDEA